MELIEFTLKAGNRLLLDKVNIQFDKHVINLWEVMELENLLLQKHV